MSYFHESLSDACSGVDTASGGDRAAARGSLNLMRRQPASKQFPTVVTSKGGSGREAGCMQAIGEDLSEVTF